MKKMAIVEDDDDSEEEEEVPIKKMAEPKKEPALTPAQEAALKKADAIRLQGNELFGSSDYESAISKYSAALDVIEGGTLSAQMALRAKCLNNRAACACQLQQYRAAIRDCSSVLEANARDAKALMDRLDRRYPGYGFARHKGYATRAHLDALRRLGPTPAHRRSFAPVSGSGLR